MTFVFIVALVEFAIAVFFYAKLRQAQRENEAITSDNENLEAILQQDSDERDAEHSRRFEAMLCNFNRNQEKLMIDTSKILAAVAEERTELASWKALVIAMAKTIKDAADALAAANAANDPAAQAAVQADLDKAATDLSTDNADAKAAIAANTAPVVEPAPAPAPAPVVDPAPTPADVPPAQ